MALYHKWDVKSGFAFVPQFFSLISDDLSGMSIIQLRIDSYQAQACHWKFLNTAHAMP